MIEIPVTSTEGQVLAICHSSTALPLGIMMLIGSILLSIIIGLLVFSSTRTDWKKFFTYIIILSLFIGFLAWILVTSPNLVQKIWSIF